MLKIVPFKKEHLIEIEKTRLSKYLDRTLTVGKAEAIEAGPHAFSFIDECDRAVLCGGVLEIYRGRGEAWAVFALGSFSRLPEITLVVREWLKRLPIRRIEAAAALDYGATRRWLEKLGFELEAPRMRAFHPMGHDCAMYAMINEVG